ncbi:hypothetical protein D9M68_867190 [compost metagenome]
MAGITIQSGSAGSGLPETGTLNPCDVRTWRRMPTMRVSKGAMRAGSMGASSLAVANTSRMADKPVSNTPSNARICIFMARTLSKMSIAPILITPAQAHNSAVFICMACMVRAGSPSCPSKTCLPWRRSPW